MRGNFDKITSRIEISIPDLLTLPEQQNKIAPDA